MEIDTSELKGKHFSCIDGCGLCCLCQPELLPPEQKVIRSDRVLAEFIVRADDDPSKKSLKMTGNGGPCALLRDRKCTIYGKRPHFCRQFPVHTHLMWRIQLTADYSCRGIWSSSSNDPRTGGSDLEEYGLKELSFYSQDKLKSELAYADNVFREFREFATANSAWDDIHRLRHDAARLIERGYFSSVEGLGSVLYAAGQAREAGVRLSDILPSAASSASRQMASSAISELSEELFSIESIADNPVYVDSSLEWNIFTKSGGRVWRRRIKDRGGTVDVSPVDISTDNIALGDGAAEELRAYARVSNSRDSFLGFIYYLVDDADYDVDVNTTYMENLAMTQLDLILRSALASPSKAGRLGAGEIADGIVYIDMDMHDAPTIGSVI